MLSGPSRNIIHIHIYSYVLSALLPPPDIPSPAIPPDVVASTTELLLVLAVRYVSAQHRRPTARENGATGDAAGLL